MTNADILTAMQADAARCNERMVKNGRIDYGSRITAKEKVWSILGSELLTIADISERIETGEQGTRHAMRRLVAEGFAEYGESVVRDGRRVMTYRRVGG